MYVPATPQVKLLLYCYCRVVGRKQASCFAGARNPLTRPFERFSAQRWTGEDEGKPVLPSTAAESTDEYLETARFCLWPSKESSLLECSSVACAGRLARGRHMFRDSCSQEDWT